MKVENKITVQATVQFQDLKIGEAYEDSEGILCIKTDDMSADECYGKCIAYVDGEWRADEEHKGRMVKPLNTTITLHSYKMKAGGGKW